MKFDERGMRQLHNEIAARIAEQDQAFRRTHGGLPVEVIVADYPNHGPSVQLPEATLRLYAESVSSGTDFEFVLGE